MHKIKALLIMGVAALFLCSCASLSGPDRGLSAAGHLARIVERGEFVVGTTGNMPPLNMTAKDGEVIGYEIDMVRMMADALGVKLKVKTMEFYELLPALELNSVDIVISGMTITPVRNLRFAFVGPYLHSGKAILAKSETIAGVSDATEVNSPSTRVAALKGSTSQEFIETVIPKAQLTATEDYDEAIRLVLEDKVDALIADYPICIVALLRYPDAGLVSTFTALTYEPYGIAMPPDDPHFMNWVENFLASMEGSGDVEYLQDKWFKSGDWIERVW